MRAGLVWLLLICAAAHAEKDPLAPTRKELGGENLDPAIYARYVESLALAQATLDEDPANVRALENAARLLAAFNRETDVLERVRKALAVAGLPERHAAALRGLKGHLMVEDALENARGVVWIFINGRIQQQELTNEQRAKLTVAAEHLREAIRMNPRDIRSREDLATALDRLDPKENAKEVAQLRAEAGALRPVIRRPDPVAHEGEAERLRHKAEALEQRAEGPDHAAALALRKQALVLDHCAYTIPFEYEAPIYGPVSLLATRQNVNRDLTRTYRKRDGTAGSVPPRHFFAPPARRLEILEGLAQDTTSAAAATLIQALAFARGDTAETGAAMASLARGHHAAAKEHLPRLLDVAVYGTTGRYPAHGQRLLIELAVKLGLTAAAPVLARLVPFDEDLTQPRGIAAALAELGGAEQAEALLAVARDPERDVYFRREAILALGRIAPERLDGVPAEPHLEIAIAAARYRSAPAEESLGRILAGLGRKHEADDAARYCADLGIEAAIPALEDFLAKETGHYARPAVDAANRALAARGRG